MNKTIVKNDYDNRYTSNEYFLNNFKNTIKRMVLTKRKEAGFIDDYNKEYNDKEMATLTIEYEVFNNVLNHIKNKSFSETMMLYEDENKENNDFKSNYLKYKYLIKEIYDCYHIRMLSANEIIDFIKMQTKRLNLRKGAIIN